MNIFYHAHFILFHLPLTEYLTCDVFSSFIQHLTSSDSKVGPLIVKPPPPLPKPRKIPEPVRREIPEPKPRRIPEVGRMKLVVPKPRRILTHKRALQAVTALAITVGVLLVAVIVLGVVLLKGNTKGRHTYIRIY